ncbi:tumor necrosis factor receptor superfamily member 4 [Genypterus blacodes]|uniref:tumor necrosis factor receptor superfamily member 4 n=1 Tax=Genypterus blacodes TaxID=154954 RepID=UPI003F77515F
MGLLRWRFFLSLIHTMAFVIVAASLTCRKGHKVSTAKGITKCEVCPVGNYMSEENASQRCRPCSRCDSQLGSEEKQSCSKTEDTKCQCRAGFIPWESNSVSCKCEGGFEQKNDECQKCQDGYFSDWGSSCSKWKECKSTGVKVNGTSTSDVVCNTDTIISTPAPSNERDDVTDEPDQAEDPLQHSTTTSAPGHGVSTKVWRQPSTPDHDYSPSGIAVLLTLGIVGLIVMSAVTCKLNIIPCLLNKTPPENMKDSSYGSPVEESGDSNCSTPLEP